MNNTAAKTNSRFTIQQIAMIAVMTAVTCVLAPLSIPIGPVPISLTNLVIYFSLFILGTKKGTISYLIYLLIGLVGIPVFSSFTSGPGKLFGPTGGYLIGFIPLALIAGFFIDHFRNKKLYCFLGIDPWNCCMLCTWNRLACCSGTYGIPGSTYGRCYSVPAG